MRPHLITILTMAALAVSSPSLADDGAVPEEMRQMFRSWLLSEPEILEEAIEILNARREETREAALRSFVEDNRDTLFKSGLPFYGSDLDDAVEILKFSDYMCGFCREAHKILDTVLDQRPDVRVIVREFPVLGHQSTLMAGLALSAFEAGGNEAWQTLHDAIFEMVGQGDIEGVFPIAESFGVDVEFILDHGFPDSIGLELSETQSLARGVMASGTPTFIIGNEVFSGLLQAGDLLRLIDGVALQDG